MTNRPYAVQYYRDKLSVWSHAQKGITVAQGYYTGKARYASREAAQNAADYHNAVSDPANPARVVNTTDERSRQ